MQLVRCRQRDTALYIRFMHSVYKQCPNYRNNTDWTVKQILGGKSVFCSNAYIHPVFIYHGDTIVAVCTFIHAAALPGYLQIAFFEALPGQTGAVALIIEQAKAICAERSIPKICIGLNGHVNYGLGLLTDQFASPVAFGDAYNPPYYIDYFAPYASRDYTFSSFRTQLGNVDFDLLTRITHKFCRKFTFRKADFGHFRREMAVYTQLNNLCFANHPFYYPRTDAEDYELFAALRLLIKEENLIFAECEGTPIGFLLWYPDFNQFVRPGKTAGIGTYLQNKLFPRRIKRFKMVEIAVLPEYQQSGAIVGLLHQCYLYTRGNYTHFETSWIWDANQDSRNLGSKLMDEEYKHFQVFEIQVGQDA